MGSASYVLGIDVGTTTCRSAIFDLQGNQCASALREIPVSYPRLMWAEVEPDVWWRATAQVIREAVTKSGIEPQAIKGVGLSGLMHAPVLLDSDGRPITPAMLWMDQRCAPQSAAMNAELHRTGDDDGSERHFSTTWTAPKLRWLAEMRPEVLAQARTLLLPKDFVRYRLTGELCTDYSDAGGTGLLDDHRDAWDWNMVDLARVPHGIIPALRSSWDAAGTVTPDAAAETGLAPGTVVAVGGGDTSCTLMGAGDLGYREVCIYLGTAAWIAFVDGRGPDGRTIMRGFGSTATTGAALRWVRDLLVGDEHVDVNASYDALTAQAAQAAPGSEGLLFLPHLMGERGPQPDPLARGALVGLTLRHGRSHMVRAILEGTAFHLRRVLDARKERLWPDSGPLAGATCGGAARSSFWMQLLADVTQVTLRVPDVVEAGVLGAAMLGGIAAGVLDRETASTQMVRIGHVYRPNPALASRYDALYARYCQLDDLLVPWFHMGDVDEA